jgi:hypothetical protein
MRSSHQIDNFADKQKPSVESFDRGFRWQQYVHQAYQAN